MNIKVNTELFDDIGGQLVPHLDIEFSPKKLARNNDPQTSKAAAQQCAELRSQHHRLIHSTLLRIGNGTIYDIRDACGLNEISIARRMKELAEVNRAEVIGERLAPTGRKCRVWIAR